MGNPEDELSPERQAANNMELRKQLDEILPPVDFDHFMTEALIPDGDGCFVVRRFEKEQSGSAIGERDTDFRIFHWGNRQMLGKTAVGEQNYVFNEAGELVDDTLEQPPVPNVVVNMLDLIKSNPDAVETGGPGAFHGPRKVE